VKFANEVKDLAQFLEAFQKENGPIISHLQNTLNVVPHLYTCVLAFQQLLKKLHGVEFMQRA
jgi:hypothetical protein